MVRALFPGHFDPIHNGHVEIARRAAGIFDELVMAVSVRPGPRPCFSFAERVEMVRLCFASDPHIWVVGYNELSYEFCRGLQAQVIVGSLSVFSDFDREFRRSLMVDRLRPEVEIVALNALNDTQDISSSLIREIAALGGDTASMVPGHVAQALKSRFTGAGRTA